MIAWLALQLAPLVGQRFARGAALALLVVALLIAIGGVKSCYDSGVIEDWTRDANNDFIERQADAEDEAEAESAERTEDHQKRVKTTEELIDEAIAKNCAVGEYLASNGARCM